VLVKQHSAARGTCGVLLGLYWYVEDCRCWCIAERRVLLGFRARYRVSSSMRVEPCPVLCCAVLCCPVLFHCQSPVHRGRYVQLCAAVVSQLCRLCCPPPAVDAVVALRNFIDDLQDMAPLKPVLKDLMAAIFNLMHKVGTAGGTGGTGLLVPLVARSLH
jgi:hypothetical protein